MFIELFREISAVLKTSFVRVVLLVGILLAAALSAQIYLHINQEAEEVSTDTQVEEVEEVEDEPEIVEINMSIPEGSWDWDPNVIEVVTGTTVILHIDNEDDFAHGFAIDELEVNEPLPPGTVTTIEFMVDLDPGEYEFYCSVWCGEGHRDHKGTLIVLASSEAGASESEKPEEETDDIDENGNLSSPPEEETDPGSEVESN